MPPQQPSNNDKIRAHISGLLDSGVDLSVKVNRDEAFNKFLKSNPGITKASARAAWSKIIPKLAAERGVNPDTVKPRRSPKVKVDKSLITNLDPHPADINPNYQQGQQPQQGQMQTGTNWQAGQQQGPQPGPQQGQPFQQQQFQQQYTVASTGAFWDSCYNFIRLMAPEAEPLSDQERNNLGETWYIPFNRYLAGKEKTALAIALLGTLSIFASKIQPALKKKREEEAAQKNLDTLRAQAKAAGQKMPKPDRPKDAEPEPNPADPLNLGTMENESND